MMSSDVALAVPGRRQSGFTYLGLIILVTIIGLSATAALHVGAVAQRREAEQELLDIGLEYISALNSYAAVTPPGQPGLPGRLEDLLTDPRFPNVKRHLRKVYIDPLTGKNEWGIVKGDLGSGPGIIGIYSLSEAKPIKIDNFDLIFTSFKNRKTYHDWIFTNQPVTDPSAPLPAAELPAAQPSASPVKPGKNR